MDPVTNSQEFISFMNGTKFVCGLFAEENLTDRRIGYLLPLHNLTIVQLQPRSEFPETDSFEFVALLHRIGQIESDNRFDYCNNVDWVNMTHII